MSTARVLVTGAGGFIGRRLAAFLKGKGRFVRSVDLKPPEYSATGADEFELLHLGKRGNCDAAIEGMDEVYALAAEMDGMGFWKSLEANAAVEVNSRGGASLEGAF